MQPQARCAVHTDSPASGTCGRCGNFVCALDLSIEGGGWCEKCRALGEAGKTPPPWERRDSLGFVAAFTQQIKSSIFEPDKFWRGLPAEGSVGQPLLFAWLVGVLQAIPAFFVQTLNFQQVKASLAIAFPHPPEWLENLSPWAFAAVLTLPVLVLFPVSFYISTALVHVGCLMWGAGNKGFNATARVLGYAQGPLLVGWVPVLGFVAIIYLVVLQVMGISRVHGTTAGKASLGVLTVPILLTCCLSMGGFVLVFVMLRNAGMR